MADNSARPRGAGGKFISDSQAQKVTQEDLPDLVHQSSGMTGALKDLQEEKEEAELEKPLLSVSVNNPVSWFMKIINRLRKKQTTTFTFRLGVPLIALPVLIAALAGLFFGLGKITSQPETYKLTKAGTLKIVRTQAKTVNYLVLADGQALELELPDLLDLSSSDGKRILVSGEYWPKDSLIKVESVADMEILPQSPEPMPTPTMTAPTATPAVEDLETSTPQSATTSGE